MAARCFPAEPEFEHHTERAVWERTRDQLPDDAVLLANLRFTDRHADLEADLVVALPGAGVAVLEVKGGAVTHDGLTWRQTGGGAQDKPIDPAGRPAAPSTPCVPTSTGTGAGGSGASASLTLSCSRPAWSPTTSTRPTVRGGWWSTARSWGPWSR